MRKSVTGSESCAFVSSNKKITFCGCRGVGKYSENEIQVKLSDFTVTVTGEKLSLSTYVSGEIVITGEIQNINYGVSKTQKSSERAVKW